MDQAYWHAIAKNNYQLPAGANIEQLTDELVPLLGTSDPAVRDYDVYSTLENWIQRGLYTPEQLRSLRQQLLANMNTGLGERENNGVLLRSFSTLALSELCRYDNKQPFLQREEVIETLEQGINYLMNEQDLRGYVAGLGWIHAVSHASDLLGTLARNRYIEQPELERILVALAEKCTLPTSYLFITVEDERIALAVVAVLSRQLIPASYWGWWGRQLAEVAEKMNWEDITNFARQEDINAYHNSRIFLHALYFQLAIAQYPFRGHQELMQAIMRTLYRLDPGFYAPEVIKMIDPTIGLDEL